MTDASSDNKPTRLMITHMVLENFKSYAGAQYVGPFHKRFSSVVGPNGSGKSNVIDALLFVFGKRAKQLRLSKVSELIHKSSNFPDLQYARVSVHFQLIHDDEGSADDFEVVSGSNFVVTRTAFKDNTSTYVVDGKSSNFSAVGKLLRTHGIDLDNNRFLILQGEVEQIALMKPKGATKHEDGLLEYLEDIIGSNCFVERIEGMSKTLEDMNDQRIEKVNRLKVAEKDRDNLSDSKLEAEAFMNKEKDIRRKQNVLLQIYQKIAVDNLTELKENFEESNTKLKEIQEASSEAGCILKEKETAYKEKNIEYNAIAKKVEESTNEFGAFERRDVKLQEDMKHNKTLSKKLQTNIDKDLAKETNCLVEADEAAKQMETLAKSLADVEEKKNAEESASAEIMAGLQEATVELRSQLEDAQVKLAEAERGIARFQTEKEAITTSLSLIKSRSANAATSVKKLNDKYAQLVADRESMSARMENAEGEKILSAQQIETLKAKLMKFEQEEVRLQSAIRVAVAASEETKASMASVGRNSSVLNSIMKATRKGGALSAVSVAGRLGDLGTIPAAYDVAVSTSCGLLDYIVTDTTEDAQKCMQFLRSNNLGRASFITIDKMSDWASRMQREIDVPDQAERLFDVIKASEDKFLPAFYFAMKDTLFVNDLDTATSIAFEGDKAKWRVVTASGGMIDTSGAMSGGGNNTRKGLMMLEGSLKAASVLSKKDSPSVTVADVQQLEAQVASLQKELRTCRSSKDDVEDEMKKHGAALKKLSNEITKIQMGLKSSSEKDTLLLDRIKTVEADIHLSPEEEKDIEAQDAKIVLIDEQIFKVSPNIAMYRNTSSSLQRKIMDVGGPKLARAQQKLEILTKQFDELSNKLASYEVVEATARANAKKASTACEKSQTEADKIMTKIENLLVEQKQMEADALQIIESVELAKASMLEHEEELELITEEFNELKSKHAKVLALEVDIKYEIDDTNKKIYQQEELLSRWCGEIELLHDKHIDEQVQFNKDVAIYLEGQVFPESTGVDDKMKEIADEDIESDTTKNQNSIEALIILSQDALQSMKSNIDEIKDEVSQLEEEREVMEKSVNMSALLEYMRKDAFYRGRAVELDAITTARNVIRVEYEDLRHQRLDMFMSGFAIITLKLKEMYQMITLGGDAELELVDSMDPFSEGIVFSVRPPKKSWKNISNLSGGEKTLSSLALVFALHHFRPTALYVMDEIDAALDFKNVSIVANYIKERTKNAQFVIISLRNNMFEVADRLVGIYKTNDATKSVTINPKSFAASTAGKLQAIPTTDKIATSLPKLLLLTKQTVS